MEDARRALDWMEIANVLSRYYQALDRGDLETLDRAVIAEGATWRLVQCRGEDRLVDEITGRSEILAWFERMLGSGVSMSEAAVRHHLDTHVIEIEGDGARSTSHLLAVETTGLSIVASGFVRASHVRTDRGWRILRYEVEENLTAADMAALREAFHADP